MLEILGNQQIGTLAVHVIERCMGSHEYGERYGCQTRPAQPSTTGAQDRGGRCRPGEGRLHPVLAGLLATAVLVRSLAALAASLAGFFRVDLVGVAALVRG